MDTDMIITLIIYVMAKYSNEHIYYYLEFFSEVYINIVDPQNEESTNTFALL
jgi:hypothetical protein